jgi:hypothetical protein
MAQGAEQGRIYGCGGNKNVAPIGKNKFRLCQVFFLFVFLIITKNTN